MENPTGATGERRLTEQTPIADILDGYHRVHYTKIEKLPKILRRGIYCGRFAARIRDNKYKPYLKGESLVHLSADIGNKHHFSGLPNRDAVGILIKRSSPTSTSHFEDENIRIAPREFTGIVFPDDYSNSGTRTDFPNPEALKRFVDQRSEEIKDILAKTNMDLPIYGTTGNLYWPERINHDQIVSRNLVVRRNPISNLLQAVSHVMRNCLE